MIKQLRRRFIVAVTASAFALLVVVLGSVNLLVIISMDTNTSEMLEIICENNGVIQSSDSYSERALDYLNPFNEFYRVNDETSYTTRFFYVSFTIDGEVELVNTDYIAAINSETAKQYALEAVKSSKEQGYIHGDYKYLLDYSEGYGITVYFMDVSRDLASVGSMLTISVIIGTVCYVLLFVIVVLVSGKAVRPIAENAVRQKQFITDAGHELKTPISIISANTEVLEMMYGENEWLTSIQNQTRRLSDLIKNLLVLSKSEEKSKSEAFSEVAISDIVSATVASFSTLAYRSGKRLFAEVQPTLTMWGNEKSIAELTSILLDNAVKYAPEGSKVELTLYQKGRQIILQTKNGLTPGTVVDTERLFDRFYRSDKSRSRETGGYGIGLSIAKAIVASHKGTLTAEIEEGKITFTVIFITKKPGDV